LSIFRRYKTGFIIIAIFIIIGLLLFAALFYYFTQNNDQLREFTKLFQINGIKTKDLTGRQTLKFPIKMPPAVVTPKPGEKAIKEDPSALDYDREIKILNDLIKLDSRNIDAFYNRAWLYASKENLQQALKDYTRVIKIDDKNGEAYYNRKDYAKALKINPNDADLFYNRGAVYLSKGQDSKAMADFKKAAQMGHAKAKDLLK
jgi:tetratricopeptide (TPR) repeat protein